jgi:hypothetical protein
VVRTKLLSLLESSHSRKVTDAIISYVGTSETRFEELVNYFLGSDLKMSQRAAWPLSYVVELHPTLVHPYLSRILKHLKNNSVHDALKRNTFRFLQEIDFHKKYDGAIADLAFHYLQGKEAIAIKVFAMSTLARICQRHPELKSELKIILEDQLPYSSSGFRSRALKVLKTLSN